MGVNRVLVIFVRFDIVTCCDWILRSCRPSIINVVVVIDVIVVTMVIIMVIEQIRTGGRRYAAGMLMAGESNARHARD